MSYWTDERMTLLKKLHADGLSNGQIAAELGGISRNAVIGKSMRLGLINTGPSLSAKRPPGVTGRRRGAQFERKPRVIDNSDAAPRFVSDGVDGSPDELDLEIPVEQRRTLMQLTDKTCRWPIGHPREPGFFFCGGATATDSPYCSFHARRAYAGIPDRHREARSFKFA